MMNLETPMPVTSMQIPEGDAGTEATIVQMRRLIDQGAADPTIHELAAQIVRNRRVRAFDWMGEARAIYEWVRSNLRFTRDVRGKETLHSAREIVRLGIGDCDDYTILICALMSTIGAKCRIITVSSDPRAPEIFSHVYPEVSIGGRWTAMDAARRDPAFGRSPARFYRKRAWDASSPDYSDIAGLGIMPMGPARRIPIPTANTGGPPLPSRRRQQQARVRFRQRRSLRGFLGLGDAITDAENTFLDTGGGGPINTLPGVFTTVPTTGGTGIVPGVVSGGPSAFTPGAISQLITAGETGAANIIAASRANPYNLVPTTSMPAGGVVYSGQPSSLMTSSFFGMSTSTLLLLGLAFAAAVALSER